MAVAVVVALLLVLLGWLFWPSSRTPASVRRERAGVDEAELEAAERDVQEASDQDSVRDWGPGASGPKPPL